jgi:SagB-type dehydrogenase family enzyme
MGTLAKLALGLVGHLKPDRVKARASPSVVTLPAPVTGGGMPVMQALALRRSRREFSSRPISEQELSNLLWAAFGVNRAADRGRTAPTAMGAQEIDVYVTMAGGVYIYEPFAHTLSLIVPADARNVTGYQDFVDEAPIDLVFVADHAHLGALPASDRMTYSAVATGAIVQNVYLYCASAGLATVARGWLDRKAIADALLLGDSEHVIVAQSVGYPRESA